MPENLLDFSAWATAGENEDTFASSQTNMPDFSDQATATDDRGASSFWPEPEKTGLMPGAPEPVLDLDGPKPSKARAQFGTSIDDVISKAAQQHGVDPDLMRTFARIESGGRPDVTTGSYKGLFQLSDAEFSRNGGRGDIFDPIANSEAAARKMRRETDWFSNRFGRAPTAAELYMMHQQGVGGAQAHWNNPDAPAWQNMASTAEGRSKGERWAKAAIWGNVPDDVKARYGSVENMTSRDFLQMWDEKVARLGGAPSARQSLPQARGRGQEDRSGSDDPSWMETAVAQAGNPAPQGDLLRRVMSAQPDQRPQIVEDYLYETLGIPRPKPAAKTKPLDFADQAQPLDFSGQAVDPDKPPERASFGDAVGRGVDIAQQLGYAAAEATGELTGIEGLTQFGREGRKRNIKEAEAYGPRSQFTDIRGIGDFVQWAKETAGEQIPIMLPSMGGFGVGALAGAPLGPIGMTIGGMIGAFIPSFALGVGEVQSAIKEKDENAVAPGWAIAGGTAIGALDSVLPGMVGSRLVRAFGKETAEEIAKRALTKPAKDGWLVRGAKGTAKGMAAEGVTEAIQEAIGEVAAAQGADKPINWSQMGEQMLEAGAAGALMGGLVGGPTAIMERGEGDGADGGKPKGQTKPKEPPKADQQQTQQQQAKPAPKAAPGQAPSEDDVAVLLADNWNMPDIIKMSPAEIAAEAADARARGVTPGPRQKAPDTPSAEPASDLVAQARDMIDPKKPRRALWLPRASLEKLLKDPKGQQELINTLRDKAVSLDDFDGQGGLLVVPDSDTAEYAQTQRESGRDMQEILGELTGAGTGKPADGRTVVQQVTPEGNVTRESLVTEDQVAATEAEFTEPGRDVRTMTPEEAVKRREEDIATQGGQAPTGDGSRAKPVKVQTTEDIERASERVQEPTEAQAESGNYRHGHLEFQGLQISIETPKGAVRRGKGWEVISPAAYGYFKGVKARAKDKESVDVYVGDSVQSDRAFVVDQYDIETGRYDEPKVILGAESQEAALAIYDAGFSDGKGPQRRRRRPAMEVSLDELRGWLNTGDATKPFSRQNVRTARGDASARVRDLAEHSGQVPESKEPVLSQLRRPGDKATSSVGEELRDVPAGRRAPSQPQDDTRPDRQRQGVPARERALGDEEGTSPQHAQEPAADTERQDADVDSVGRGDRPRSVNPSVSAETGGDDSRAGADNTAPGRKKTDPVSLPTFSELMDALPKDEEGNPDVVALANTIRETTGKRAWNQLSDEEKRAVWARMPRRSEGADTDVETAAEAEPKPARQPTAQEDEKAPETGPSDSEVTSTDKADKSDSDLSAQSDEGQTRRPRRYDGPPLTDDDIDAIVDSWKYIVETWRQPKPRSLTQYIIDGGGIVDRNGEIRHLTGGPKGRPGLIRKGGDTQPGMFGPSETTNSIDDWALRAWEAGFFPEHIERPTIQEFLDVLRDDLHEGNVVHPEDQRWFEDQRVADLMAEELLDYGIRPNEFRKEETLRAYFGQRPDQRRPTASEEAPRDQAQEGEAADDIPFDVEPEPAAEPKPAEPTKEAPKQPKDRGQDQLKDWSGIEITGYLAPGEEGSGEKDGALKRAFLSDARSYLIKVAKILEQRGFAPYTVEKKGRKGKTTEKMRPVTVNAGGVAVSGDVALNMIDAEDRGVHVTIGTALAGPAGGISLMARTQDRNKRSGQNNWWNTDLSASELADRLEKLARGSVTETAKPTSAEPAAKPTLPSQPGEPDLSFIPHAGWRDHQARARVYANALKIDHRGMSTEEIVAAIDAKLAELIGAPDGVSIRLSDWTLDGDEARVMGGEYKAVATRERPFSAVDGYGDTPEAAIRNAMLILSRRAQKAGKAPAVHTEASGQTSLVPPPTTQDQIRAESGKRGKPKRDQEPMDVGMFGSDKDQTDLVDMAKKPAESAFEKATREAKEYVVRKGKETGIEHGVIVRQDGTSVILSTDGNRSNWLEITPEKAPDLFKGDERVLEVHHNHPSSNSFSKSDIEFGTSLKPLKRIHAHGHNGSSYRAELLLDAGKSDEVGKAFRNADETIKGHITRAIIQGRVDNAVANAYHYHVLNLALDEAGVINYEAEFADKAAAEAGIAQIRNELAPHWERIVSNIKRTADVPDRRTGTIRAGEEVEGAPSRAPEAGPERAGSERGDGARPADDTRDRGRREEERPELSADERTLGQAILDNFPGHGNRLMFARLRKLVPSLSKPQFAQAIRSLQAKGLTTIYQMDNRRDLTDEDRAAAVMIGTDPRHFVFGDDQQRAALASALAPTQESATQAFDPAAHIKLVADDISKVRKADLERLFEEAPRDREAWTDLRIYLIENRSDLAADVLDAISALGGYPKTQEEIESDEGSKKRRAERAELNRRIVPFIQDFLANGGRVQSTTVYRVIPLTKPEQIRLTNDGTVQIIEGRKWVTLFDTGVDDLAKQAGWKGEAAPEASDATLAETENWWRSELTPAGRRLAVEDAGLKAAVAKTAWQHLSPESKNALAKVYTEKYQPKPTEAAKAEPAHNARLRNLLDVFHVSELQKVANAIGADKGNASTVDQLLEAISARANEANDPVAAVKSAIERADLDPARVLEGEIRDWLGQRDVVRGSVRTHLEGALRDIEGDDVTGAILLARRAAKNTSNNEINEWAGTLDERFNKPKEPSTEGGKPDRDAVEAQDQDNPLAKVRDRLLGEGFKTIVDARKFVRELGVDGTNKEIDEFVEAAVVEAARDIVSGAKRAGRDQHTVYNRMVMLYGNQPNLGTRTATSVANQAYSTPVPLAYLASRLARVAGADVVFEPSAGNGALLIEAGSGNDAVYANEIDENRASELERQGFTVTTEDATEGPQLEQPADAIVMNPPFGAVREGGKSKSWTIDGWTTTQIDHAIALKALEQMTDNGRAVLIVGGIKADSVEERRKGYRAKGKREFYWRLYKDYNVTDHFTAAGELYTKQGASWPVDVIVIEGRGKSSRQLPASQPPTIYASWEALAEKLPDVATTDTKAPGRPDRPTGNASQGGARPARGNAGTGAKAGGRGPERLPSERDNDAGSVRGDGDSRKPADVGRGDNDGLSVKSPSDRDGGRTGKPAASEQLGPRVDQPKRQRPKATGGQSNYEPASRARALDTLIPVNMADAAKEAITHIEDRHGPVDEFVADRLGYAGGGRSNAFLNAFSAEQVDAIAAAIDNIERGSAMIVGDQTGIGKGRIAAALLRYAIRQGKIPVLVTEKPDLYGDMWRDLRDIGIEDMLGREPRIFITNTGASIPLDEKALEWKQEADEAKEAGEKIPKKYGKYLIGSGKERQAKEMDAIARGKGEYDFVFTTYDQMNTVKGMDTKRRQFIQRIAPNALISYDESHNAGGAGQSGWKKNEAAPMNRAEFAREIASNAWGVMFSSATYAKRPEVMDLYARTDMGRAVDDPKDLPDLIARGGVPMQQIVASMLTNAGQYMRRERSFEGVEYAVEGVPVNEESYRQFSDAIRAVFQFDLLLEPIKEDIIKDILDEMGAGQGKDGGTGSGGASSISFGSVMHNIVNQMLLAIKTNEVAKRAIRAHKDGEKPVIALASTMESFISDFVDGEGIKFGDPIDLTFRDVLARYLRRTLRILIKHPDGRKEYYFIPMEKLPTELQRMYRDTLDIINEGVWDSLPISPIDALRHQLSEAGMRAVEITGRQTMIDYSESPPKYAQRPKKERGPTGKRSSIAAFNRGDLDALIINRSGSTGVSMHASTAFKDQRRRRMIIAQAEGNIDTHLQTLGRVHRTGQVIPPAYSQVAAEIPAEARPTAVLMKKMASLNANTTGARGSVFMTEAVDFMNEIGDRVVVAVALEDRTLLRRLGNPIATNENGNLKVEGAARAVTGRLTLLDPKEQAELLDKISTAYKAEIQHLDQLGENPLEAKTVDLQARSLEVTEVKAKQGDGPFLEAVNLEKVSVKAQGRAMPPDEVAARVAETMKVKRPGEDPAFSLKMLEPQGREWARKMVEEVSEKARAFISADVASVGPDSREKTKERLQNNLRRWIGTMHVVFPGARVKLTMPAGDVVGIVVGVEGTGKTKNPVGLSSWDVTIAVPDSDRQYIFPMSKLFPPSETKSDDEKGAEIKPDGTPYPTLMEQFEEARKEGRETRFIFTGNILASYEQTGGTGQIINYTTEQGELRPGILMRRDFSHEKFMEKRKVRFQSAEQIVQFLARAPDVVVVSTDGFVKLIKGHNAYAIDIAAARAKGGKYYTDSKVREALAPLEIERKASLMIVDGVPEAKFIAAVDRIRQIGALFEVREAQEVASEIISQSQPAEATPPPAKPEASKTTKAVKSFKGSVDSLKDELGIKTRPMNPDEDEPGLREDDNPLTTLKTQLQRMERGSRIPVIAQHIAGYSAEANRILSVYEQQEDIDPTDGTISDLAQFLSSLSDLAQIVEAQSQKGYRLTGEIEEVRDALSEQLYDISSDMSEIQDNAESLMSDLSELAEEVDDRLEGLQGPAIEEESEDDTAITIYQPTTSLMHKSHPPIEEGDSFVDVGRKEVFASLTVFKTLAERADEVRSVDIDAADVALLERVRERIDNIQAELLSVVDWARVFGSQSDQKSSEVVEVIDGLSEERLVPVIDKVDEAQADLQDRMYDVEHELNNKREIAAGQIIEIDGEQYGPTRVAEHIDNKEAILDMLRGRLEAVEAGEAPETGVPQDAASLRAEIEVNEEEIKKYRDALHRYREANPDRGAFMAALAAADTQTGRAMRRTLDALGFYSHAIEAAKALRQEKGTPEQMLAQLKKAGVKDAEIAATQLDDFFARRQREFDQGTGRLNQTPPRDAQGGFSAVVLTPEESADLQARVRGAVPFKSKAPIVTRDEIVRHLEQNRVTLEKTVYEPDEFGIDWSELGFDVGSEGGRTARWQRNSLDPKNPSYTETLLHLPRKETGSWEVHPDPEGGWMIIDRETGERYAKNLGIFDPEHAEEMARELNQEWGFRSEHFDVPNIIGHMQSSLVEDWNGDAVYLINQVQSDWGQRLRDDARNAHAQRLFGKSFRDLSPDERKAVSGSIAEERKAGRIPAGARDDARIAELKRQIAGAKDKISEAAKGWTVETVAENALTGQREILIRDPQGRTVSRRFGFSGTDEDALHAAVLRRGEFARLEAELQTLERSVPYHPMVATTEQWLTTTLRRALRQAVEAGADFIAIPSGETVLSYNPGDTEGMEGFYDRIVPKVMRDVLRAHDKSTPQPKWVETVNTPTLGPAGRGFTVFEITDAMRRRVLEEGQALFAISRQVMTDDAVVRRVAKNRVEAGGGFEVAPEVTDALLDAAASPMRFAPRAVRVAAVTRMRRHPDPAYADEYVLATFREPDGRTVEIPIPNDLAFTSRALFHRGSKRILLTRLTFSAELRPTLLGEVWHELVHAIRSLGLLTGGEWSRLVRHADALGVLRIPLDDYLRFVGDPSWAEGERSEVTVHDNYLDVYDGLANLDERIDQESVAHLVELVSHGAFTEGQVAPVLDILQYIASGELARAKPPKGWRDPLSATTREVRSASLVDQATPQERRALASDLTDAVNIVGRIAGKDVDVQFFDRIPAGDAVNDRSRRALENVALPETAGGYYRAVIDASTGKLDGTALIALATNDPAYDPRTTAGHEAWHHVETVLARPEEMRLLRSPSEMARLARHAAAETGRSVDEVSRLPDYEIRAIAFQRYRRLREEGAQPAGLHIGVRRFWDRLVRIFHGVRNVVSRNVPARQALEGAGSSEAIFERARSGQLAARGPAPRSDAARGFGEIQQASILPNISQPAVLKRRARRTLARAMNLVDKARIKVQDRVLPVRRVQEVIEDETGSKLPLSLDVYLAEALYHGRAGERLTDLQTRFIEPLIQRLRASGIKMEELGEYLYARHARERNEVIRGMDPDNDAGSGMSDGEADGILARIRNSGRQAQFDELAGIVDEMIEDARDTLLRAGLISREQYEEWGEMYQSYVPLRGFEFVDEEADPDRPRVGRGFDVRGREAFRALGRRSVADNPVLYAVLQAQQAIVRAEKNRVNKTLYRLIQAHPDASLWKVYTGEYRRRRNPDTGLVEKYWVPPAFIRKENLHGVKIGGKQHWFEIKHPALARAIRGTGAEVQGTILGRAMFWAARKYAGLLTAYNPEFLFSNIFRDVQTAILNIGDIAEKPEGIRRKIVKEAISTKAIRGAFKALRGDATSEYARWFEEFRLAGGKISWMEFNDVERIRSNINKSLTQGRTMRALRNAAQLVEDINTAVENGVRLTVFKALRENGVATDRAAFVARELTVNFNRKGEYGPGINAAYLFFNASVQGTTRIAQALVRSKAVRYAVASIFGTGLALDILNSLVSGDDDDGENFYDSIPLWVKERNLIIMLPGSKSYVMIPMPYGYNVPYLAGQQLASVFRGVQKPMPAAASVAAGMIEAFNPLGSASYSNQMPNLYQIAAPTFADPVVQALENRTWYGAPIYPTKFDKREPWSETYFASAPWWAKELASAMNRATGGNQARPGIVDISPEVLEHYAQFAMGGVGKFVLNTWATGERLVTGEEWLPEETPIARRLYGKATTASRRRDFYEAWNEVDAAYYEMRELAKTGDLEGAQTARQTYRAELAAHAPLKATYKSLRALRKRRDVIEADTSLSRTEKLRRREEIVKQENAVISRALVIYNRAIKQNGSQ